VRAFSTPASERGTPFEIASTPVTGTSGAKACITTNSVRPEQDAVALLAEVDHARGAVRRLGKPPFISWNRPQPRRTIMLMMKKYVGTAKTRRTPRTPRRLPNAMRTTNETEIGTAYGVRIGMQEATAAVRPRGHDTVST